MAWEEEPILPALEQRDQRIERAVEHFGHVLDSDRVAEKGLGFPQLVVRTPAEW